MFFKKIKNLVAENNDVLADAKVKMVLNTAASMLNFKNYFEASKDPAFYELALTIARLMASGIPVPYLEGSVQFSGLEIQVFPGVFIPRQETELLVEKCYEKVIEKYRIPDGLKFLDIGTGTGAIAVALAKKLPSAHFLALDKSELAARNALLNVKKNGLENVEVKNISLEDFLKTSKGITFDVIISNPPYVGEFERGLMPKSVVSFEPEDALFGGKLGLEFYRILFESLRVLLKDDGIYFFEIGYNQMKDVAKLASSFGFTSEFIKDYSNIHRIVWGIKR
ncbi:MAG: peptide chain release factor N(5)-glutamine methyltransferase [Actinobacteria bacterium]|nr:peptide chain release factor N(5)-glutamine methyltransferase [Actinomycetota bacterium]